VARELLDMEAVSLPWGALYQALHVMELTGEVRRGYFVEGFTGAQFALPRAADELKALQQRSASHVTSLVLLNACDPANLYGGAVRLSAPAAENEGSDESEMDDAEDTSLTPSPARATAVRLPSNYLVLRNGVPALLLETGARRLTALLSLGGEDLAAACGALRDLTEHPWPLRPVRQLRIERWAPRRGEERPIRGSEAEAPLRAIGFSLSPKGLEL
jgi:ATP-dependent helicase Lhr and Lhr-like helicase